MSSPNHRLVTPDKRRVSSGQGRESDAELLQSLRQLSLSNGSPSTPTPTALARSPSASYKPAVDRSPSALSVRASSRSPFHNPSNGRESRSATPTLLRKASMNSLGSVSGVAPPRRSTSGNMSPSVSRTASSPEITRPPPPTANAVARKHFRGELELLHCDESNRIADTIVVLHDSCYGHRFSRPRTSRNALSTIVERPERIKACVLGVAAAYVLLGERHCEGEYPPHPNLHAAAIPSVPFRIRKSNRRLSLSSPAVTNVHGTKWMEELKIMCDTAEAKLAMGGKELQRPEMNRGSDHEEPRKLHEGDLYLCQESLEALEGSLGAVCDAVDAVFQDGGPKRAFVAVRPPGHHCSASYPSGFCWVNNVHVGIMHAILGHGLTHAAIIDFDLHHGDGSQAIAWQHNSRGVGLAKNAAYWKKSSIGYFSLHDINSYPCEMGDEDKVKNASLCIDNAHGQNVWNVHLEPWKTEAEFWDLYEDKYAILLEKARKFLKGHAAKLRMANQTSKAAIFFSAGFDASEWEGAGMQRHSVSVPTSFYARIARDVTRIAEEEGTSVNGRLISVLEGGYSDRALTSGVLSHVSGLAGSDPTAMRGHHGLGSEMAGVIGASHNRRNSLELKMRPHEYSPSWWNSENLEVLENGVVLTPPPPRVQRSFTPGNYSSPTHASTQKMVEVARLRRQASMNGLAPPTRAPTPPPPEVPWHVAAHGLCAILTPADRTTTSCRPEDLSAEATRARRERHMVLNGIPDDPPPPPPPPPAPSRMSLRERKPTSYFEGDDDDLFKNRRRTVAGTAIHDLARGTSRSSTPQLNVRPGTKQEVRRLSAASTVVESLDGGPIILPTVRPQTSMTQRPDTSMSIRTTATEAPLAVKKTRGNNAAKREAPQQPLKAKKSTAAASKTGSTSSSTTRPQSSVPPSNKTGDDLDSLTSGIKKITLVTKQQKEARARAGKKPAGARASSASDYATGSSLPATPAEGFTPQQSSDSKTNNNYGTVQSKGTASAQEPSQHFPIADDRAVTPVRPFQEAQAPNTDVFIQYQPEGPVPAILAPQGPLEWMPVDAGETPSPAKQPAPSAAATPSLIKQQGDTALSIASPSPMKRADLPIFTPTSQLRFASQTGGGQSSVPARGMDEAIWEIPETPQSEQV